MDDEKKMGGRQGGGDSGGGAYPNPHTGKEGADRGGFLDHSGQTEMAYHGRGRLGGRKTGANPNAPAANTKPAQDDGSPQD